MTVMHHETVLVIGGSGFIGSHMVARLAASGRRVVVPTRHLPRASHLLVLPTVQVVEADIHDGAALDRLIAQVDAVVNLVGVLHSKPGNPWGPQFEQAHVALPRRIAQVCSRLGVKRCLHMCALGAASDAPSMYQRSKAAGEQLMRTTSELEVTSFRPSVVFGPEDQFLNVFARMQALLPVMVVGGADAKFQPVFVGDLAQAFVDALDDPRSVGKVYELVGPHVYTLRELIRLSGTYSHHRRPVIGLPASLARVQAFVLEHMPGGPIMSRDNLDSMKADNVASGNYPLPPAWHPTALEAVAPHYLAPH
jgi:NADH dehydrogenase